MEDVMLGDMQVETYNWVKEGLLPPFVFLENKYGPYTEKLKCFEVTTECPKLKQPDFGEIFITYVPRNKIIETRSLKEYMKAFRDKSMFQEEVVLQVCHDIWEQADPLYIRVEGKFNSRGGIEQGAIVEKGDKSCLIK